MVLWEILTRQSPTEIFVNDAAKYTIFEQPEIEDTSREIVKYILISKTICTFTIWIKVKEVIVFIHLKVEVNTLIGESPYRWKPLDSGTHSAPSPRTLASCFWFSLFETSVVSHRLDTTRLISYSFMVSLHFAYLPEHCRFRKECLLPSRLQF